MSVNEQTKLIKQNLLDKHVERTEVYIGNEAIPYWVTEVVNMPMSKFWSLVTPITSHLSKSELNNLLEELDASIDTTVLYTSRDREQRHEVSYIHIDKEYLFDLLDDYARIANATNLKNNRYAEDRILYVTKRK